MQKLADFEEVLPKLQKIELFSDFSGKSQKELKIMRLIYENLKIKDFTAGETIIQEGSKGDLFYILYSGSVQVLQSTFEGDQIALANLNSTMNIFFGESALISDDVRTATIVATTDCRTITLSKKAFTTICEEEPLFGYKVLLHLAQRMISTIHSSNMDKATLYEALYNEIANS
ncbi:cyclic nucleotide-binding domain-containing protein [Treponema sp.]|uniref:cyclic nucleotide-binding domain-containing protein n=1 Tax=Treponema sp. TaxID=166 RepID=UPI0025FBC280|nr:cyclic nucleotide-binding domain-containing protein [Treponema sp.]MCR5218650.1 cyclic nucleotide-binding domain-containing protein [Treponema sp.]